MVGFNKVPAQDSPDSGRSMLCTCRMIDPMKRTKIWSFPRMLLFLVSFYAVLSERVRCSVVASSLWLFYVGMHDI